MATFHKRLTKLGKPPLLISFLWQYVNTDTLTEDPSDDKTWIGYQIRWKAFITIFPNLKKGKTGTDAIRVNDITKIEASKAKQIDGIIGISAPIRTKEELQKIASKYNPPSKKPEKIL